MKIGDKVYVVDVGNLARNGLGRHREGEVTKVGRKYFTVSWGKGSWAEYQFHLSNNQQKTEYSETYKLYKSEKEYLETTEVEKWANAFRSAFRYSTPSASLDCFRLAGDILNIKLGDE